jgi:hypothetical protein
MSYVLLKLDNSSANAANISVSGEVEPLANTISKRTNTGGVKASSITTNAVAPPSGDLNLSNGANTILLSSNNGITLTGSSVSCVANPTSANHIATKQYVDAIAANITWKQAVRLKTVAPLPAYNKTGAESARLYTATSNDLLTIDGVSVAVGDRILLDQNLSVASDAGIFEVITTGSASSTWSLKRANDANNDPTGEVVAGMSVLVTEGATCADKQYLLSTNNPIVLGSTAQTWINFSAGSGSSVELNNEIARAMAAETSLGNQISTETTNRIDMMTTVNSIISPDPMTLDMLSIVRRGENGEIYTNGVNTPSITSAGDLTLNSSGVVQANAPTLGNHLTNKTYVDSKGFLGDWSSATSYVAGNRVIRVNSSYKCVTANTNSDPISSGSDISLLANTFTTFSGNMNNNLELGMQFTSTNSGWLTAIKFYKIAGDAGTSRTLTLWSPTTYIVATLTTSSEPASGWITTYFTSPVYIIANTKYIVSRSMTASGTQFPTTSNSNLNQSQGITLVNNLYGTKGTYPTFTHASFLGTDVIFKVDGNSNWMKEIIGADSSTQVKADISFDLCKNASDVNTAYAVARRDVNGNFSIANPTSSSHAATKSYADSLGYIGEWSSVTAYKVGQEVTRFNNFYKCVTDNTNSDPMTTGSEIKLITDSSVASFTTYSDANNYEFATGFQSSSNGWITGIRFYRYATSGGTSRNVSLWDFNTKTLLARGTTSGENTSTASWVTFYFTIPIEIKANTPYLVSRNQLAGTQSPIHNLGAVNQTLGLTLYGSNGYYSNASGMNSFPSNVSGNNTFYGIDPIFKTDGNANWTREISTVESGGNIKLQACYDVCKGASDANTAYAVARRDVNGNFSIANPTSSSHAATKSYVDMCSYQGVWNSSTAYYTGNRVSFGNSLFKCLNNNTNSHPLGPNEYGYVATTVTPTTTLSDPSFNEIGYLFFPTVSGWITGVQIYMPLVGDDVLTNRNIKLWDYNTKSLIHSEKCPLTNMSPGWNLLPFLNPIYVPEQTDLMISRDFMPGNGSLVPLCPGNIAQMSTTKIASVYSSWYSTTRDAFPDKWMSAAANMHCMVSPLFRPSTSTNWQLETVGFNPSSMFKARAAFNAATTDTYITSKLLTGYSSAAGTISASDSILTAINKLNGNFSALQSSSGSITEYAGYAHGTYNVGDVVSKSGKLYRSTASNLGTAPTAPNDVLFDLGSYTPTIVPISTQAELGFKFTSIAAECLTAFGYYKSSLTTGTSRYFTIWDVETKLPIVKKLVSTETNDDWNTITLDEPVYLQAGKQYIISREHGGGSCSADTTASVSALFDVTRITVNGGCYSSLNTTSSLALLQAGNSVKGAFPNNDLNYYFGIYPIFNSTINPWTLLSYGPSTLSLNNANSAFNSVANSTSSVAPLSIVKRDNTGSASFNNLTVESLTVANDNPVYAYISGTPATPVSVSVTINDAWGAGQMVSDSSYVPFTTISASGITTNVGSNISRIVPLTSGIYKISLQCYFVSSDWIEIGLFEWDTGGVNYPTPTPVARSEVFRSERMHQTNSWVIRGECVVNLTAGHNYEMIAGSTSNSQTAYWGATFNGTTNVAQSGSYYLIQKMR